MKVIIIGLNHSGCAAARTLLNLGVKDITIYDKSRDISFLSCGMALWIGGHLSSGNGLFYATAKDFTDAGAQVFTETNITLIDFQFKTIHGVRPNGEKFTDSYDKLILATGTASRVLPVPGAQLDNIVYPKFYRDALKAIEILKKPYVENVAVIGGGYIGIELAEACQLLGKKVRIIDLAPRLMYTHTDKKFSQKFEELMASHGIQMNFEESVVAFEGDGRLQYVKTENNRFQADMAFINVGVRPVTNLGNGVLKLGVNGCFEVDQHQETSVKDVYAIGDCASIYHNSLQEVSHVALASSAIRSGIVCAHNVAGIPMLSRGTQGSSGLCIYDLRLVTTGLSLKTAQEKGIDVSYVDIVSQQLPPHIKPVDNPEVHLRIVYRKKDRVVIGAQMMSTYDMSGGIHMYSLAIQQRITVDKLALLDGFYTPLISGENYYCKAAAKAP